MTISLRNSQPATHRLRTAIQSVALLSFAALLLAVPASAQDKGPCSNATLKGEYASFISGEGLLFGVYQKFVGISLRNYDGSGNFTEELASFHGSIVGAVGPLLSTPGTYTVNANCTGTSSLNPPGLPPIVSDFVLMNEAKEVREIVTSPAQNVVSAVFKRL
jgi:hypothetical protein